MLADVGTGFALHHVDLNGTQPLHDPLRPVTPTRDGTVGCWWTTIAWCSWPMTGVLGTSCTAGATVP